MNETKLEVCTIYFPRALKFISLTNEDSELVKQIYDLVKEHKKLLDLWAVQKLIETNKKI